jgi:TRAP-type mannitol/chloroaromatic compound transport system substrate-binding protein
MKRRDFITKAGLGTAAAVAGSGLAAPAIAQGSKTMTIVTTWPRDFPGLGLSAQRLAKRITEISDGAIQTEYFAAGERVAAFDSFDEVASGNSQAYIAADYYWQGTHPGWAFFTAVPFGMSTIEHNAWIRYKGGQELWDKHAADYGLKNLLAGSTGTQAGGWFNKEMNSVDDWKGLKMRIPGLGGAVLTRLGASTVSLPGSQIFENLTSGAIDATEWVGPYNDYFLRFFEAAKYYYTGGMHEIGGKIAMGMNASWWGSLTKYEQTVIQAAAAEEDAAQYEETYAYNGVYLKKLIEEEGVQMREFSDDSWDAFGEATAAVLEETRDHSARAKEIADAYRTAMLETGETIAKFELQAVNQRNRVLGLT